MMSCFYLNAPFGLGVDVSLSLPEFLRMNFCVSCLLLEIFTLFELTILGSIMNVTSFKRYNKYFPSDSGK